MNNHDNDGNNNSNNNNNETSFPGDAAEEQRLCLEMFLGGLLDVRDISMAQEEEEEEEKEVAAACTTIFSSRTQQEQKQEQKQNDQKQEQNNEKATTPKNTTYTCSYATSSNSNLFQFASYHQYRPPVQVVEFPTSENKGKGLISTQFIPKGEVIWIERSAIAVQNPSQTQAQAQTAATTTFVKACQNCFRSLEPISKLYPDHPTKKGQTSTMAKEKSSSTAKKDTKDCTNFLLPYPHLWPVPEFSYTKSNHTATDTDIDIYNMIHSASSTSESTSTSFWEDDYGRVQCQGCRSWFCTRQCQKLFWEQLGSCCQINDVQYRATNSSRRQALLEENQNNNTSQNNDHSLLLSSAEALSIYMFAFLLQRYKQTAIATDANTHANTINQYHGTPMEALCGEPHDIVALEIGEQQQQQQPQQPSAYSEYTYTLQNIYNDIVEVYSMSEPEQALLTCDTLHQLAAMAARNGIDMATQSPFSAYYNALLRTTGGRGSYRHDDIKAQVAQCLNQHCNIDDHTDDDDHHTDSSATASSKTLERVMDDLVESFVLPQISGIFPLTACMNHSCQPNVQILNQQFVDARIDLVATQDIPKGQELCISYIGHGNIMGHTTRRSHTRSHYQRRQRLLQARYLFECRCPQCESEKKS